MITIVFVPPHPVGLLLDAAPLVVHVHHLEYLGRAGLPRVDHYGVLEDKADRTQSPVLLDHASGVRDIAAFERLMVNDFWPVHVPEALLKVNREVDSPGDLGGGRGLIDLVRELLDQDGAGKSSGQELAGERESDFLPGMYCCVVEDSGVDV